MAHNFKEGIDWIADPTGATPLASHLFVSKSGSDSTGTGSPSSPFRTIHKAYNAGVNWNTIIVGTGIYSERLNVAGSKRVSIKGDGYVIIDGGGSTGGHDLNGYLFNLIIINFQEFIMPSSANGATINDCTILSCPSVGNPNTTGNPQFNRCIFIDSHIKSLGNSSRIYNSTNCIHINCSLTAENGRINGCFFDADCQIHINYDLPDAYGGTAINNNVLTTSINVGGTNGFQYISKDPQFNNVGGFDFSLKSTSPHLGTGLNGSVLAAGYIGDSFYQGIRALDNAVSMNPNISYNELGEVQNTGVNDYEIITLDEVEFEFLRYIGKLRISGFPDLISNIPDSNNALFNPNNLVLEMRWAMLDGVWSNWHLFRWNEIPTVDQNGKSNGDSGYSWATNNKVMAKKYQIRLTILKGGVYNAA